MFKKASIGSLSSLKVSSVSRLVLNPPSTSRYIATYLHSSTRIRGLKRDKDEYLTVHHNDRNMHIENLDTSAFHKEVSEKLNFAQYGIKLDESLILQCLTHKSFAHGIKPYNEKLSFMGYQFIKYFSIVKDMAKTYKDTTLSSTGPNKSIIGSFESKKALSNDVLNKVFESYNMEDMVFWKKRALDHNEGNYNGEFTVHATCLKAIVGAILLKNGEEKTKLFFENELYHKIQTLAEK